MNCRFVKNRGYKMAEKETVTASKKLNDFMEKYRTAFIIVLVAIICFLIGFISTTAILNSSKSKDIAKIEEISYTLTSGSTSLEEAELNTRCDTALSELAAFTKKGGIVGARANMLCADITYDQEKYAESIEYWKATAEKAKKSYLAPLAYFNMGVCNEELNNIEAACENYKTAAQYKDFVLKAHAKFSYGRTLEALGKTEDAIAVYTELNDNSPEDSFAKLAKTRLIAIQ